jgi:hypothetical protein
MDNVTFIEIDDNRGNLIPYAIIDHGNEQFTSMLKSDYDKQQAEQSTPNLAD